MRIELRRIGRIIKIRTNNFDHNTIVVCVEEDLRSIVVLNLTYEIESFDVEISPEYSRFRIPLGHGPSGIMCDTLKEAKRYFELISRGLNELVNEEYPDAKIFRKSQVRLVTLR